MVKRKYYIPRCKGLEGVPWYEACLKLRKHNEIDWGSDKMGFKTVKLKITKKSILATWRCPSCGRINSEWLYDDPQRIALHCHHCGEHFEGELE